MSEYLIARLKGQCHKIFDPRFFHQNIRPGHLIMGLKAFLNINSNSRRYSNFRTTSKSENHM
jgi:hypothetical protein